VVTQTLVAEGDGRWQEYAGGYSDWLLQRPQKETASLERTTTATPVRTTERPQASTRKLGFREQRELAELPVRIEALEQEQAGLLASMANAPANELHAASLRAAAIGEELEAAFVRWSELEERANAG
jgi:ATP-binding cassette subfamily F protein uup